ncbi:hypothetical protein [Pseudomonas sp. 008]|uniref:hypothetical protein n=1 Tax=Pseudomonas sp. 008 TaxID=2803906 RepID=UPI001952261B|nr:hypothetical protein [Pseudomonas sp. 008]GID03220.1 hypothetical protein TMM008_04220 [Pseudomonas sp. 008]
MKINKIDIARRQLDVAVDIFLSDGDLISVITLAGAAEEIFGTIVSVGGKENAVKFLVRSHKSLGSKLVEKEIRNHANLVRNALKHADRDSDENIEFDERQEAIAMLSRALTNFSKIDMNGAFPLMEKVYEQMHQIRNA